MTGFSPRVDAQETVAVARRQTLPSGLRIVVLPRKGSGSVVLELRVRSGSADAPPGGAHLLEHSVFHGGRDRAHGEIDRVMETIGGEIDARTFRDSVRYRVEVPADRWRDALAILAELTLTATLPQNRFEIERQIIAQERRYSQIDPVRAGTQRLFQIWFPGDPYGLDPLGSLSDLAALTSETLASLHRKNYRPDHMSLVVGGQVDPDEVLRVADALFVGDANAPKFRSAGAPAPRPEAPAREPVADLVENARIVWLHAGFRIDATDADGVARAEAVAHWLADPVYGLWSALPESRKPYLIQSEVFPLRRAILGVARCATEPKHAESTIEALGERIRAIASAPDTLFDVQWKTLQAGLLAKFDRVGASVGEAVARAAQHEGRDAAGDDERIRAAIVRLSASEMRDAFAQLAMPGGIRLVRTGAATPGETPEPLEGKP